MVDLHFKNEEHFNSFIKNLQFIGLGSEGYCYKLDKGIVLNHLCGPYYTPKSKEDILKFKDINIPNYIFVQNLVYIKEQIVGVLMHYVNGKNVKKGLYNINILNLIKALDDLIIATKKLSSYGITVFDVCPVNMLYNKGRFYFIDTMDYKKSEGDINGSFNINMKNILYDMYDKMFTKSILDFIKTIPEIKDFRQDKDLLVNPSYVLKILLERLNNYFGFEIKTIEEASKKLVKN